MQTKSSQISPFYKTNPIVGWYCLDPLIGHFSPESNEYCGQGVLQKRERIAQFGRIQPKG